MNNINPDKKEWKFVQCYRSKYNGSCNTCRTRTWKRGHKVYGWQNPTTKKWCACTDKKCYLEQGGLLELHEHNKPLTKKQQPDLQDYITAPVKESKSEKALYAMDCRRCRKILGYSIVSFSQKIHYCTSCVVMTVRGKEQQ